MKFRTLLMIACILFVGLVGLTVAGVSGQNQAASRAILQAVQLTDAEVENILYMRQEEKLARDVYLTLYEKWDVAIFANISESEQRHMDAIKKLITIYGLEDPIVDDTVGQFTDPIFTVLFEQFVADGSVSLLDALNVGVAIEEQDIADLNAALDETTMRNVRRVFQNLLRGSTRHLAAFEKCIETCDTDCICPGDGTCLQDPDQEQNQDQNRDMTCQSL